LIKSRFSILTVGVAMKCESDEVEKENYYEFFIEDFTCFCICGMSWDHL